MTNPRYLDHRAPSPALVDNAFRSLTKELFEHDQARADMMQVVRDALYEYGDLAELARITGRSERCLYSIRCGFTRWPRWETLFGILPHLGLQLAVIKIATKEYH